jgi:hypothetical protein
MYFLDPLFCNDYMKQKGVNWSYFLKNENEGYI